MTPSTFAPQRKITWIVLAFLVLGEIMLFSATAVMGVQRYGSEFHYLTRQSICVVVGLALMLALSRVPYQFWSRVAYPLLALQLALVAATHIGPFGHHALGASRWLNLGFIAFQPSELARLTVTLYIARLLTREASAPTLQATARVWLIRLVPIALLLVMILRQPDLGTTVLLTAVALSLFFLAGLPIRPLLAVFGSAAVAVAVLLVTSEYRRRRLTAFLDPWADPQGAGFQTIQSFLSLSSGKLFGVGLGNGNSKLFFLPEVHTDFIFALIGEELGFLGTFSVLLLFAYLIYLLLKAALAAPDAFGRYVGFGLTLSLALQIAVNLGGVTGLMPVKGLPLPFLSWGRSALLVNLAMMGILLNIVRQASPPREAGKRRESG